MFIITNCKLSRCLRFLKIHTNPLILAGLCTELNAEKLLHCRNFCNIERAVPKKVPWNVLFFGSDEFSLESLRSLYNEYKSERIRRLEIVTVCKKTQNVVAKYANDHGLTVNTWPVMNKLTDFHIGVVVSFGHLIPSHIINSFPLGVLNIHASLLPRWRGAAPIIYSLMNGDNHTGVTVMKIKPKKFDIGDIVKQASVDIGVDETMPELHSKLAKLGASVLLQTFKELPEILLAVKPQDTTGITHAPKVTSEIAWVNWSEMTAVNIYNLQRALTGLYRLMTTFNETTIKLLDVRPKNVPTDVADCQQKVPGFVKFNKAANEIIVKCKGDTWISVKKIMLPGRPCMSARDFNNGFIKRHKKTSVLFGQA